MTNDERERPESGDVLAEEEDTPIREEDILAYRRKKKRRKIIRWCLLTILFLTVGYIGIHLYMDYRTMGCRVMVLGEDVSFKTVEEAAAILEEKFASRKIIFRENGKELYTVTLGEAGYSLNEQHLKQKLEEVKEKKPSCRLGFQKWMNYIVFIQTEENGETLGQTLDVSHFGGNEGREASTDAYIVFNEEKYEFGIVDSVLGTRIDSTKLFRNTEGIVGQQFGEKLLDGDIYIDIDSTFYQEAAVMENQEELMAQLDKLNTTLKTYSQASVTYTFGSVTEVVEGETLRSWIKVDGLDISLDEEAIKNYISQLGATYNTIYVPRNFHTSGGSDIVISGNEYGYRIDEDGEFSQLLADIKSGETVSREPVYSSRGYQRNGNDDLMGSYVEISIDSQQLWLYKDGSLITQTGVVTGLPTPERATLTGAFPLAFKASPFVLSSDVYGYETPVTYWMPFAMGQGLHDASWQSSFGGQVYKTNGSHGCVNLPKDQAALIYEYVDTGFPIIIY